MDDFEIFDYIGAYAIEPGDTIVVDGDLCVVRDVDADRDDIDEVFVRVDNISGGEDEFSLYADDQIGLWHYV